MARRKGGAEELYVIRAIIFFLFLLTIGNYGVIVILTLILKGINAIAQAFT